jgi:hypothetical protein
MVRGPTAVRSSTGLPSASSSAASWILRRLSSRPGSGDAGEVERARARASGPSRPPASAFRAPHAVAGRARPRSAHWGLEARGVAPDDARPVAPGAASRQQVAEEVGRLADAPRRPAPPRSSSTTPRGDVLAYIGSRRLRLPRRWGGRTTACRCAASLGARSSHSSTPSRFERGFTPATVHSPTSRPRPWPPRSGAYAPQKLRPPRPRVPCARARALASSFNVPAVRLAERPRRSQPLLDGAAPPPGSSHSMRAPSTTASGWRSGNGEVSLWEAARAYAGLARGGVAAPSRLVPRCRSAPTAGCSRRCRELTPQALRRPARAAALVTHVLADNAARARTFGLDSALRLAFPVAVKTGTSKGYLRQLDRRLHARAHRGRVGRQLRRHVPCCRSRESAAPGPSSRGR